MRSNELPVFLDVVTLHHHYQGIRLGEFLLELEKIMVIFLIGPHQVVLVLVEVEVAVGLGQGVNHADHEQHHLRPENPSGMTDHHRRQPGQQPREKTVSA